MHNFIIKINLLYLFHNAKLKFLYKKIKNSFSKNILDDLLDELEIFKGKEKFVVRKK